MSCLWAVDDWREGTRGGYKSDGRRRRGRRQAVLNLFDRTQRALPQEMNHVNSVLLSIADEPLLPVFHPARAHGRRAPITAFHTPTRAAAFHPSLHYRFIRCARHLAGTALRRDAARAVHAPIHRSTPSYHCLAACTASPLIDVICIPST